jgi:uncharacterized protein YqhQ
MSEKNSKPKFDFAVGGQALIEGVMMRSKNFLAMAVRKDDGTILIEDQFYNSWVQRFKWANTPFLRGVINMFEMMIVGTKAINFSANEFIDEDEKEKEANKKKKTNHLVESLLFALNIAFALALSIFLFKFLPLILTEGLNKLAPTIGDNYVLYNAIDGVLKLLIFVAYILLIMISKTVRRVFQYHGAEHMAVFNYEEGTPLTVENTAKQSRFHPRCGTSFIIFIFLISIVLYTFIPRHEVFWIHFTRRILILPVIAGVSYEVLKLSAKYSDSWWVKLFIAPGLAFQRLTTSQPDESQMEVAIAALKRTLELEEKHEGKN